MLMMQYFHNVEDTNLAGTLPPQVGWLTSIEELVITDCSLSRTLPSELGSQKILLA